MKKGLVALALVCFSTYVYADTPAMPGPAVINNVLLLAGFLFIFYFMLIRPQSKRAKEHQNLISSLAVDDEVIINGGFLGRIAKVSDQFLVVALNDGVEVRVQKQAITGSIPKGTLKSI